MIRTTLIKRTPGLKINALWIQDGHFDESTLLEWLLYLDFEPSIDSMFSGFLARLILNPIIQEFKLA